MVIASELKPSACVIHLMRKCLVDRTLGWLQPTVIDAELPHKCCKYKLQSVNSNYIGKLSQIKSSSLQCKQTCPACQLLQSYKLQRL